MADVASMIQQALEIRKALLLAGVKIEKIRPFVCTLSELEEFKAITASAGPMSPVEGGVVKIAGLEFYVVPERGPPGFFGVWHEAWETCCRVHAIDSTELERERCEEQSRYSFYNPQKVSMGG
jgi:hypothetical protein